MSEPIENSLPPASADAAGGEVDDVVAEVREMNGDDWGTFEANEVRADALIRLEFEFAAPNEAAAEELAEFLRTETEYDTITRGPESEYDDWAVVGSTAEVSVSEEGLDLWVQRMAAAGWANGACRFDGWSALLE